MGERPLEQMSLKHFNVEAMLKHEVTVLRGEIGMFPTACETLPLVLVQENYGFAQLLLSRREFLCTQKMNLLWTQC